MPDYIIGPIAELHSLAGGAGLRRGERMRDTGVVRDVAIAVIDDKVAEIGPAHEIIRRYDLSKNPAGLVTPGLVDAHSHICWAGDRAEEFLRRSRGESYEDIAAAGGGILSTMRATREAKTRDLAQNIGRRAHMMRYTGSTTVEVKASYGLSPDACMRELDAIHIARDLTTTRLVPTFMGAHAFPPDYSKEEYLDLLCDEMIPMAAAHRAMPRFCDVFCEVGAFSVDESERVLRAGLESGLKPKIHADEFNALGGVEMACAMGAVSCDHLLVTTTSGRRALEESATAAVLMPGTAFYLGKPYADARALVDSGCAVALGTDFNPGSSMVRSMALTIGLAVAKQGLTPEEALTAATVNSAAAIDADTGRIEVGLPADIVAWQCRTLAEFVWQYTYIRAERVYGGA
ncbi:MAG: imidazolonepropionase [Fimbriimonadales bacterium]